MIKAKKTTDEYIESTFNKGTEFYGTGEIKYCGVKYEGAARGWVAKLKLFDETSFVENSFKSANRASEKLNLRIRKIIKRYNAI